jgi:hypothetical protein
MNELYWHPAMQVMYKIVLVGYHFWISNYGVDLVYFFTCIARHTFGDPDFGDPDLAPRFGTRIWDRDLAPRFGTPIWNPDLGGDILKSNYNTLQLFCSNVSGGGNCVAICDGAGVSLKCCECIYDRKWDIFSDKKWLHW